MSPKHLILHILLLTASTAMTYSSNPSFNFDEAEQNLVEVFQVLIENPSKENNQHFSNDFEEVLNQKGAFSYPFDSLENVGKLTSDNGLVRIFTWNLPLAVGVHQHNGFVMVKHHGSVTVYRLKDSRSDVEEAFSDILPPDKWYGALYYYLHQEEYQGVFYYSLLGVSLKDLFTTQRIIEPLWIDHEGKPMFGTPIFNIRGRKISRVVLEYTARANVMLRYSPEMEMLVFDHLVPSRPQYRGIYSHYGPDLSHDGLRFEGGEWHFEQNIDLRNPRRRRQATPIESSEPGFIYKRNQGSANH